MAKGLRASSRKKNNQALRAKVFAPAYDARTARLSAKLQELAAQPKPDHHKGMEVDEDPAAQINGDKLQSEINEMDVDARGTKMKPVTKRSMRPGNRGRIERKVARRKEKNTVVFASVLRAKKAKAIKNKKRK